MGGKVGKMYLFLHLLLKECDEYNKILQKLAKYIPKVYLWEKFGKQSNFFIPFGNPNSIVNKIWFYCRKEDDESYFRHAQYWWTVRPFSTGLANTTMIYSRWKSCATSVNLKGFQFVFESMISFRVLEGIFLKGHNYYFNDSKIVSTLNMFLIDATCM